MAITKLYDLVVKTGEYTNGNGETKARYENIGSVMRNDKGQFALLKKTFNPAGVPGDPSRDSVMVSMFEPRDNSGGQRQQGGGYGAGGQPSGGGSYGGGAPSRDLDDEVPW